MKEKPTIIKLAASPKKDQTTPWSWINENPKVYYLGKIQDLKPLIFCDFEAQPIPKEKKPKNLGNALGIYNFAERKNRKNEKSKCHVKN